MLSVELSRQELMGDYTWRMIDNNLVPVLDDYKCQTDVGVVVSCSKQ